MDPRANVCFIVDDDAPAREALALLMTALGWSVQSFAKPRDLLAALEERRPALVLTDLSMPGLSGAELAELLARRENQLPVVVITGFDPEAPLPRRARAAGAEILYKPFQDHELARAIDAALERRARTSFGPPARPGAIADVDFRLMFETMPEPRAILSPDLTILAANRCYCDATLTQVEEIVGRPLFEIFPDDPANPAGRLEAQAMFERVVKQRRPDRVIQKYSLHRPEAAGGGLVERYWSTSAAPIFDADGTLRYIVVRPEDVTALLEQRRERGAAARDDMARELFERALEVQEANRELRGEIARRTEAVHDREQAMTELARSNEELAQFAYAASHDLQSPLNAIIQFAQILQRRLGPGAPGELLEPLDFIETSGRRMRQLIADLLSLARVGHGPAPEPVATAEVLREVGERLGLGAPGASGQLEVESALPVIVGQRVELLQLFQNLVGNGLKFQRPGARPQVRISARDEGGDWHFIVADNGIGIAPENLEKIFSVFTRLHAASDYPGTGIGLALCQKIVQHHGGRMWVESRPGSGSRFHFTLAPATR